jgi:hypothetical protein
VPGVATIATGSELAFVASYIEDLRIVGIDRDDPFVAKICAEAWDENFIPILAGVLTLEEALSPPY